MHLFIFFYLGRVDRQQRRTKKVKKPSSLKKESVKKTRQWTRLIEVNDLYSQAGIDYVKAFFCDLQNWFTSFIIVVEFSRKKKHHPMHPHCKGHIQRLSVSLSTK